MADKFPIDTHTKSVTPGTAFQYNNKRYAAIGINDAYVFDTWLRAQPKFTVEALKIIASRQHSFVFVADLEELTKSVAADWLYIQSLCLAVSSDGLIRAVMKTDENNIDTSDWLKNASRFIPKPEVEKAMKLLGLDVEACSTVIQLLDGD